VPYNKLACLPLNTYMCGKLAAANAALICRTKLAMAMDEMDKNVEVVEKQLQTRVTVEQDNVALFTRSLDENKGAIFLGQQSFERGKFIGVSIADMDLFYDLVTNRPGADVVLNGILQIASKSALVMEMLKGDTLPNFKQQLHSGVRQLIVMNELNYFIGSDKFVAIPPCATKAYSIYYTGFKSAKYRCYHMNIGFKEVDVGHGKNDKLWWYANRMCLHLVGDASLTALPWFFCSGKEVRVTTRSYYSRVVDYHLEICGIKKSTMAPRVRLVYDFGLHLTTSLPEYEEVLFYPNFNKPSYDEHYVLAVMSLFRGHSMELIHMFYGIREAKIPSSVRDRARLDVCEGRSLIHHFVVNRGPGFTRMTLRDKIVKSLPEVFVLYQGWVYYSLGSFRVLRNGDDAMGSFRVSKYNGYVRLVPLNYGVFDIYCASDGCGHRSSHYHSYEVRNYSSRKTGDSTMYQE